MKDKLIVNNNWLKAISKLDDNQIISLSKSIEKSYNRAVADAKLEYKNELNKLNNNLSDIYSVIINWKFQYLNSMNTEYYILSQYYSPSIFRELKGNDFEKVAKVNLLFSSIFKSTVKAEFEINEKKICDGLYLFNKYKILYDSSQKIIDLVNKDRNNSIKLATIQNFELESFIDIYEKYNYLKAEYKTKITKLIDEKYSIQEQNSELKFQIKNLKEEVFTQQSLFEKQENHLDLIKNEAVKKDYFTNPQFNNLYWGDNYPALKVLFDFLQANQIYRYSWSHFASQMSIGDLTVIQFYTGNINKRELGYLFSKIKPYFSLEFKNNNIHYFSFLKRKFAIDDKFIDDTYCKNNIRNYKKSKYNIKTKEELDFLCNKIGSRYF